MAGCSHIYGGAAVGFENRWCRLLTAPWEMSPKPSPPPRTQENHASIVVAYVRPPVAARLDLYVPRVLGCNVCKHVA